MVRIIFDRNCCIGCGACAALCPENWELIDGKAHPKNLNPKEVGCNEEAESACPQSCITVKK